MMFATPSATPATESGTTVSRESASYPGMGDLLPRRRAQRILVVDDQPAIAGLMCQLLTMRGYDVVTASNVDQAKPKRRCGGARLT